jgi:FAD/FMN-containing dehydrogenase
MTQAVIDHDQTRLDDRLIEGLRVRFRGRLIVPGDPDYDDARRVWNGMVDRRPALIAQCTGTADVIAAVNFARENGLLVAVRGGGHSLPGFSTCDGGIVIDLSPMKGVWVGPERRVARARAGVTWGEFDHETQAFGLATTGGVVSHTGISGLTLGGGVGLLMRKHGLTVDNLLAVDIVMADGRLMHASEDENADLFWGLRDGGGNFGIATSFEYRLHPVGPEVYGGLILWPIERARDVLRFYREFCAAAPDEVLTIAALFRVPEETPYPEALQGRTALLISCCHCGTLAQAERDLGPLRSFGPPAAVLLGPRPYVLMNSLSDETYAWGKRYYMKTGFVDRLSDALIDACLDLAADLPAPLAEIDIHQLGGAIARVPGGATAFGNRRSPFAFNVINVWSDGAEDAAQLGWARRTYDALQAFGTGGSYINVQADVGDEIVRNAYGRETYARLAALKRMYDPTNLFRLNQNIRPA